MKVELTLKEKIGQMIIVGMNGKKIDERIKNLILNYKIGGIILYRKNFKNYEEMVKLISEIKQLNSKNKVPLFIAIDQEGGRVNRMPPEINNIKSAYRLAKTENLNIIKETGDITGEMLQKSGYNMNFSPVLDILSKNTSKGIGNRCFGENAEDVSTYGLEIMKQLQKHKVISVVKHFPGQGAAKLDSHFLLPSIKKIEDEAVEPFKDAIKENVDAIMVGHMIIKSVSKLYPASLSKKMVKIIRRKYKFRGLIITDDLKMKSIRYFYGTKRAVKKAFLAGNDIIMFRFNKKDEINAIENIIKLVEKGKLKNSRINNSVNRILNIKEKYEISDTKEIEKINIDEINNRIDIVNTFVTDEEQKYLQD
ncbi:MAG: beta-N-acetylhexosaminidase [Clostridia bacterium]|nr:beta-N-acetylhexosaminidase [Clostridia bacterium]